MKHIAILGSTGYIGKSLIQPMVQMEDVKLYLFSRKKIKVGELVKSFSLRNKSIYIGDYEELDNFSYDLIINCTGIGNPTVLKKDPSSIFEVTEYFDTLIINYLKKNSCTIYLNLSSGAVYGVSSSSPFSERSESLLRINELNQSEYYSVAKINSEAKHRALKDLHIIDLRIFSFFSSFVDIEARFLLSDIVSTLKSKKVFETSDVDMVRDFITPTDLIQVVDIVLQKGKINDSFDMYSLAPITKFEILNYFNKKFNLKIKLVKGTDFVSPTGAKNEYYSISRKLELLGYKPKHSSLSGIDFEMTNIIL